MLPANNAPMRSYVAQATYQEERTQQMSYVMAARSSAFIAGPALQAAFTLLKCSSADANSSHLTFDMYSAPG